MVHQSNWQTRIDKTLSIWADSPKGITIPGEVLADAKLLARESEV